MDLWKNGGARSLARASPGSPGISLGSTIEMELTIITFVLSGRWEAFLA